MSGSPKVANAIKKQSSRQARSKSTQARQFKNPWLIETLQALPNASSVAFGDSPNVRVKLDRMARFEDGQAVVRAFGLRLAELLLSQPAQRLHPLDITYLQTCVARATAWPPAYESVTDLHREFRREMHAQMSPIVPNSQRAFLLNQDFDNLTRRLLLSIIQSCRDAYVNPYQIGQRVRFQLPAEVGEGGGEGEVYALGRAYGEREATVSVDWQDWSLTLKLSQVELI